MKLHSYLVVSRHGIFYFRITYCIGTIRKERRWSLLTRDPAEARRLSLKICATLAGHTMQNNGLIANGHPGRDTKMAEDKKNLAELITTFKSRTGSEMKIEVDQSDPADVAAAKELAKTFIQEDAKSLLPVNVGSVNQSVITTGGFVRGVIEANTEKLNANIDELISRYQKRQAGRLSKKTLYEYGQLQRKFAAWLKSGEGKGIVNLAKVGRKEIAGYIDLVIKEGVSLQTIQRKYLASLSGLFEFAQTVGEYPQGDLPTKNHKLYTHRDQKKSKSKSGWKPFSDEDLSLIFNPENFLEWDKPCDFWLPLLGLFTVGRLSELCQLKPANIRKIDGIWAIDINEDDEGQTVKTAAGVRVIPLHPKLIELGFLDYVEDVRPYGGTIFPYMTPDKFNHFGKTPGRRFGEYLDSLGISDKKKVFHSFRSTSNDRLKQNGVPEESRCQFVGHEYDTVNSKTYSKKHGVKYLRDKVAVHLTFDHLDYNQLHYPSKQMKLKLDQLMKKAKMGKDHKEARALRGG